MNEEQFAMKAMTEEFEGEIDNRDLNLDETPVVETEELASTFLNLIRSRERKLEDIEIFRENKIAEINEWCDAAMMQVKASILYFQQPLQIFMESRNRENEKVKSIKFPNGTIGLRKSPDRIEIDRNFQPDQHPEDKFVKSVVKTIYSVDKKAIADQAKETGEVPDYAVLIPGETKFYYKFQEEDNGTD